ncbi:hypothetical protein C8F04DRAFT_1190340 [Mycena alexandri]|uniref:Uncharacterized protein n=1 Tax=Mycena alexandri TaxID=1745969 RepID=A0AAD6WX75_9AGAR|nr:hypothetical protein C8F04DRAFT_1190340 [Mycena alexandri]
MTRLDFGPPARQQFYCCIKICSELLLSGVRTPDFILKSVSVSYTGISIAPWAADQIRRLYNAPTAPAEVGEAGDICDRVIRLQTANSVLVAPVAPTRVSLTTPIPSTAGSSQPNATASRLRKRRLDDETPLENQKRRRAAR